ncbi:type II toxin-antitoxin system RelE/ParE family toxin [Arcobacter vandammei]|uniref:type II toxin-antitoxin system RelE/ParE family toxin n=1 Tax=Arcobacter vandammei TaxID=2782243 RepID=UPI0018DFF55D|nr:type II toxin-antitoxin system RelE/ParE family toxin [Arcobacter vandammei]
MQIIRDTKYLIKIQSIVEYIAKDSIFRAFDFLDSLDEQINNLPNMPLKCRKSIYFDDENIRDLIFKGYVIPYKIDIDKKQITIIGINKYKKSMF